MKRALFIIISLLSYILVCASAQPDYYFKQLSLPEGLSQSTVKCILYDHKGFIWIGTKSGLNRFDKHEMKTYFSEKSNKTSLPDNQILFLAEDSLNNLWIGTEGGLALYNWKDDNFSTILFNNQPIHAYSYLLTDGGFILAGNSLYKYDYNTKEIKEIDIKNKGVIHDFIGFIEPWIDNSWIIGTRWDGIWLYNQKTESFSRSTIYPYKYISAYYIDIRKNLWISPYGKVIECYSPDGRLLAKYNTSNSSLSNDIILDITEKDGNLWFATDGGGICIFNPHQKSFSTIKHISGDANSLPVNSIYCLYLDKENNMWAGTIREGALGIREVYMKTFGAVPFNNPYGLSEKAVISLYEDEDNILWIGTDGGGLNVMNQQTNTFKHYPLGYKNKVTSITEFSKNELLISIFGEGLYIFNKNTGQTQPFIFIDKEKNNKTCRKGISINVNKTSPTQIYLFADTIYAYDLSNNTFSRTKLKGFKKDAEAPTGSLNIIWNNEYVTYLYGINNIFELNNKTNVLTPIYYCDNLTHINTVCRDSKGRFWIGTTRGLAYYDPLNNESKNIETKLFHEISSIICDKSNRIWIGAQGMLFVYIINENKFAILGESDGASANEYLSIANLISRSGDIYMGGTSGLLRIKKDITFDDTTYPTAEIMDIQLDGVSILNKISPNSTLSIPWNHTSLSIKVMMREKDIFRKKMLRFNIIGLNNIYNIESYDHTLTLHSLPSGNYDITVSCTTQDGSWTLPISILTISVTPPWWRNPWFILSIALVIIGSIILIFMFSIKRKENKLKWKMKEHEQKIYEEKIRFLINISHELRTPLTLIYAPLKRLLNNTHFEENVQKQLTGIYKQTKQMKNIINMVLDVRKMEVGQDKLQIHPHPLNEWIRSIAEDFRNEFDAKKIQLIYQLDDSIQQVSFDESKCEIVLSNLLMNALKFSSEQTQITISTTKMTENTIRISVKDQGIGLNGIDTSKLFTRFYQGNHDRQGSGIGLSYAKMLIEMQGGKIGAIDNEDEGATFFYELPLTVAQENIACEGKPYLNELLYSPEENMPEINDFSTNAYSVLIVEDEPELRNFLKEALNEQFKKIYTAEDGINALNIINQYLPDIVVSDVMMPRMDGFELCKVIKSSIDISHIPVILLTARHDSESTSLGYKLGADAYLSKPFELEFLTTLITNQLKNREQIRSRYKNSVTIIPPEKSTFSNADEEFMLKLNKLINENLSDNNLDVKFLVDRLGMSRSSLYSKVKSLTDMGVNDYINKFRIEHAAKLLVQTDLSIMEISEMLGFNNQSYFSTAFKQAIGVSPSRYKEENKKEDL